MTQTYYYTVNVLGEYVQAAKQAGYNAYYASGVTAIEVKASNKRDARSIVRRICGQDAKIVLVFE